MKLIFGVFLMSILTACATPYQRHYELTDFPPPARKIENVRVALALGGGGARGIAHLGVLEVFEEHNIPIDLIVGTSAGSIIGGMYANFKDTQIMHRQLINLKKWDLIDFSLGNTLLFFSDLKGPVEGYNLEDFIVKNTTVNNVEETDIPFVAVATDLNEGKVYAFESGPLPLAIHASSAIPPVFTPVQAYSKLLVDGGVLEPVPVGVARTYDPEVVIAVDISTPGDEGQLRNMLDVTSRSLAVAYYRLSIMQSYSADVTIHPKLSDIGTFDDKNHLEVYQRGRDAAIAALPRVNAVLRSKNIIK